MKTPRDFDFTVTREESGVRVVFAPTDSHYDFRLLADAKNIARFGPLNGDVLVRRGKTGDSGEYDASEVMAAARRLAEKAVID